MISRVQSGAVLGIDGYSVEVEANLAPCGGGNRLIFYIVVRSC